MPTVPSYWITIVVNDITISHGSDNFPKGSNSSHKRIYFRIMSHPCTIKLHGHIRNCISRITFLSPEQPLIFHIFTDDPFLEIQIHEKENGGSFNPKDRYRLATKIPPGIEVTFRIIISPRYQCQ